MHPVKRRSWVRSIVLVVLQVACIAYVAHVLYRERGGLSRALDLGWFAVAALVVLMVVQHLQRTAEFTTMLRRLGVEEPFWDGFLLTGAGFLLNHLPLNAGFLMRAAVLKKDHALPYAKYLSLVGVSGLVNLGVAALLGLVSVLLLSDDRAATLPLVLVLGAMFGGASVALVLPLGWIPKRQGFVFGRLRALAEGVASIRGNGRSVLVLVGLALSKVVMSGLRMVICFDALGIQVSPLAAGLLGSTMVVLSLINITPGNLGLRELALAVVWSSLGASYALGMAAASIDRMVLLLYTVATGLPGVYSLRRRGLFRPAEGA